MDESEIEKIINKTLDVRKKTQYWKGWSDPNISSTIATMLAGALIISLLVNIAGIAVLTSDNNANLVEKLFKQMDCYDLKVISESDDLTYSEQTTIQRHMLSKCL